MKPLFWLCEWNLGEQRGKRAMGEQTGSLNRVFFPDSRPFSRIWGLFGDSGPFWGLGAFLGDSGPFSGIWTLFQGFMAFFGDSWPFRGFTAFSQIHGFTAKKGSEGSERATLRNFRYLIFSLRVNITHTHTLTHTQTKHTHIHTQRLNNVPKWLFRKFLLNMLLIIRETGTLRGKSLNLVSNRNCGHFSLIKAFYWSWFPWSRQSLHFITQIYIHLNSVISTGGNPSICYSNHRAQDDPVYLITIQVEFLINDQCEVTFWKQAFSWQLLTHFHMMKLERFCNLDEQHGKSLLHHFYMGQFWVTYHE